MAWVINTDTSEMPFSQIGMLSGDGLAAEDRSKRAQVAEVFRNGGRLLDPEEQPTRLDLTDTSDIAKVPALFASMSMIMVANSACHDVFIGMAPDAVQSWPLALSHNGVALDPEPWYAINLWLRLPSIDIDNSDVKHSKSFDGVVRPRLRLRRKKVALHVGAGGGHHIWRDETFPYAIIASEEMKQALERAGALRAIECFPTGVA